jgi:predicted ATPase
MKTALARHDSILRTCIESHGGYVFKTVGDAFCAAFGTAAEGMHAALDAQVALLAAPWEVPGGIRVRMGLHTGTAEERDGDYFGQTLNRVARLFSTGYGGQTLVSLVTAELLRDLLPDDVFLQDLGAHRLKDLLRPESIFQLVKTGLRSDFPALKSLDNHPHNLPLEPSPFVGREKEREAVQALLANEQVRVVTLTGIGGTGKTRLSLHAAADLIETFPDGVFFVDLSAIDSAAHVIPMIARTLELRETGARPLKEVLKDALRDKRMLLILDNFEQVMAGVPHVVELLAGCSMLKLLITSREALHIRAERVYRVPPLSVPTLRDAREMIPSRLSQYEAVTLFIERATAVVPDFHVTNENAPAVAEICARLDGLPLAIELAAARVNILTPAAILDRLGNRLKLLSGGAADLPFRQRTLRAAIDWSYRLLSPSEQMLFRELSVFVGGCTLQAIEAVCSCRAEEGIDVFETLSSLVGKSMLSGEERLGGAHRFFMFESLREYGLELLDGSRAKTEVREAHARYFLERAEAASSRPRGIGLKDELDALEADHDNFRVAIDWFRDGTGTESGLRLCAALGLYWQVRGHLTEGMAYCTHALETVNKEPTPPRAEAMLTLGVLEYEKGEYEASAVTVGRALALFNDLGDALGTAHCRNRLGWSAFCLNDFSLAGQHFNAARATDTVDDAILIASADRGLGCVALMSDHFEEAFTRLERSRTEFSRSGDVLQLSRVLNDMTTMYSRQKDYERALQCGREALDNWQRLGDTSGIMTTFNNMGFLYLQLRRLREAQESYELLLAAANRAGNTRWMCLALIGLSDTMMATGDMDNVLERVTRAQALAGEEGWELERGNLLRIRAEISVRKKKYAEAVTLFEQSKLLLRIANDTEDIVLVEQGQAEATKALA